MQQYDNGDFSFAYRGTNRPDLDRNSAVVGSVIICIYLKGNLVSDFVKEGNQGHHLTQSLFLTCTYLPLRVIVRKVVKRPARV